MAGKELVDGGSGGVDSTMLFAEGLLTKDQVVQEFGIPTNLESDLFAILKPRVGKLYLKKDVGPALEKVLGVEKRPSCVIDGSPLDKEYSNVIGMSQGSDNDLAVVLREAFEWMKPRIEAMLPEQQKESSMKVLTPEQAATKMRLNVQTLMKWCREGRLIASKVGGKWLIPEEAIDAYIRKCEVVRGSRGGK